MTRAAHPGCAALVTPRGSAPERAVHQLGLLRRVLLRRPGRRRSGCLAGHDPQRARHLDPTELLLEPLGHERPRALVARLVLDPDQLGAGVLLDRLRDLVDGDRVEPLDAEDGRLAVATLRALGVELVD